MATIACTLARIKADPLACLGGADHVNQLFHQAGHCWRKCVWDPAATIGMFILQVLHRNTAIAELRHLSDVDVKESSYCEARMRLPVEAVAKVVESLCGDCCRHMRQANLWLGRRVFLADATSVTVPDEPALQALWPQPSAQKIGCGFPIIKLLGLLDLATGMIVQLTMMCLNVHEMSQLAGMHAVLKAGDVLLADRGFCSFAHVVMLRKSSVDAVFRLHQRQIADFTPNRPHRSKRGKFTRRGMPTSRYVRRLGHEDQIVQWARPDKPDWMSEAEYELMPQWLEVRELRYRITMRGRRTRVVTVVTTLLDPMRYPKQQIENLYGLRWEIETNFRHLKTTMKMEHLKCQTIEGVIKELMIFVLVYNLIRAAMTMGAGRQGVQPSRISFIDAARWLRSQCKPPGRRGVVEFKVNPVRPGRWHPRVLKRRIKPYDLMNRPRHQYAEPTEEQEVTT